MGGYISTVAIMIGIYAVVAVGLNIIVGFAGQISLGHAAFFGIGAYASAILCTKFGFTFWWALPAAELFDLEDHPVIGHFGHPPSRRSASGNCHLPGSPGAGSG